MDLSSVEKLLKKINNLWENIKEDGQLQPMEVELLRGYVARLHEELSGGADVIKQKAVAVDNTAHQPILEEVPVIGPNVEQILIDNTDHKSDVYADVSEVDIRAKERAQREAEREARRAEREARRREDNGYTDDDSPAREEEPSTEAASLEATSKHFQNIQHKVVTEDISTNDTKKSTSSTDDMIALFEELAIVDVSDRLSMTPISDLSKAMGINEKIFTVRELFNKDQDLYNKTIDDLNRCSTFEEAKDYLIQGVASANQWDDPSKSKKASNFIKLVQRRFK